MKVQSFECMRVEIVKLLLKNNADYESKGDFRNVYDHDRGKYIKTMETPLEAAMRKEKNSARDLSTGRQKELNNIYYSNLRKVIEILNN